MMSMFTADFLRDTKRNLSILDGEPPDVGFTPQGYLTLATTEDQALQMIDSHKLQIELGALVELYSPEQIKLKFPHINTDGVLLGSYGVQNEGWFDPWSLLLSIRAKAHSLGTEQVHAEVIDFNFRTIGEDYYESDSESRLSCQQAIIRQPDGNMRQIQFAIGIICCGPQSENIAKLLGYGSKRGFRSIDFPVEPR